MIHTNTTDSIRVKLICNVGDVTLKHNIYIIIVVAIYITSLKIKKHHQNYYTIHNLFFLSNPTVSLEIQS